MTPAWSTDKTERRVYASRTDAGRVLAEQLARYRGTPNLVVLGLARGGLPVAREVAAFLEAPLDAFVVRKLGAPGREEFALGAIASGGHKVLNKDVISDLGVKRETLAAIIEREQNELERRERTYRGGKAPINVEDKTVIIVDDGLATGASMIVAIEAIRAHNPNRIVVAVPTAPESACRALREMVDDVVCAMTPVPFYAVGEFYRDFSQTTDDDVRRILRESDARRPAARAPGQGPSMTQSAASGDLGRAVVLAESGMPPAETLLEFVGDADIVLIGESSHGTHEFYQARAEMTKILIEKKGFTGIAAEADWPDAYRVNRYVRGRGSDRSAAEALEGFERFPSWMWRNTVVRDFTEWLREHNSRAETHRQPPAGFYGLDLYSLRRSMDEVVKYLERVSPQAAHVARERYACFDHMDGDDGQSYGYSAAYGAGKKCEQEVIDQLRDVQRHAAEFMREDSATASDEQFYAERNAAAVRNAEAYYRSMFGGHISSWNLRDRHMAETLEALREHLTKANESPARIVVWAHNSHVGDARGSELGNKGELTLGQLVRQNKRLRSRSIGFTTYTGSVTAASAWGGPVYRKTVRPALRESVEDVFHGVGLESFWIPASVLPETRLERAIGVIYRPETERRSHYFRARASDRFDALIHIERTRALEPLDRAETWKISETPETYPSGL